MSLARDLFVEIDAGDAVFKEGEVGGALYIIESGQIDLMPAGGGDALVTLGPGDSCGEAALLKQHPHAITALARTRTRLLRIESTAVPEVLRQNADIGYALLRKLAARQSHYESRLGESTRAAAAAPVPAPRPAVAPPSTPKPAEPAPAARQAPVPSAAPVPAAAPALTPEKSAAPQALALRVVASGHILPLDPARNEFLVGRPDLASGSQPEIDLGPFDTQRTLSRRHAKIVREGAQYCVREDAPTTNGTFLNGERVQTGVAMPLRPSDKLRFGSIEVELIGAQEST
jgi:hypothetical protein